MYCGFCGREIPDDAKACPFCTSAVTDGSQSKTSAPPNNEPGLMGGQPMEPGLSAAPPVASQGSSTDNYVCQVCGYVLGSLDKVCSRCKTPRGMRVDVSAATPGSYTYTQGYEFVNTSGMHGDVPQEVKGGWNWGAFYFNWIWGIVHKTWITLIVLGLSAVDVILRLIIAPSSFTPQKFPAPGSPPFGATAPTPPGLVILNVIIWLTGLGLNIWFGLKGNEWAWQNRHFESIAHFKKVERIWAYWVLGVFLSGVVLLILAIGAMGLLAASTMSPGVPK